MAQLEAWGVILRMVKKKRHSFFIFASYEDKNSSSLEEEPQDSVVKRNKEEEQRESVCKPHPNCPPLTTMEFVHIEFEKLELRFANKFMANLEGKFVEKTKNEEILVERVEREIDFLKS